MNVVDFYRDRPEYRSMYLNNLYKSAINGLRNGNANPQIIGETGEALCDEGYVTLGSKLMLLALQTSENKLGPYAHLNHSAYINHLYNGTVKTQLWTMAVILVLVILLSIAIMKSHRHKKMLKSIQTFAAEEERRHINEVKDMHKVSASLLSMALFTDEQLKEYNLFVHRKLKAGQAKDLFMEVQSGEYIQSLSENSLQNSTNLSWTVSPDLSTNSTRYSLPAASSRFCPAGACRPNCASRHSCDSVSTTAPSYRRYSACR